jgi:outer membrane protein TolC
MRRLSSLILLGVLVSVTTTGCHKPYFITEVDYAYYNTVSGDYHHENYEHDLPVSPEPPRSVRSPAAKTKWELSLEEVKRIALESNKQIIYLGYQPGEAGTVIDSQLSAFDAFFELGGGWSRQDRQVSTNIQTFGTGRTAVQQDLFGTQVGQGGFGVNSTLGGATQDALSTVPGADVLGISKRNAAGGLTRFSYGLDYVRTDPVSQFILVNPSWRSYVDFRVEQPLLQGAGVEHNRAPILIARANHEQSIKSFEASVRTLLRDVENAYWQLYFTYEDLYSRETGMKQGLTAWQNEKNKLDVGQAAPQDVAQAREQFEFFRAQVTQALSRVLAAERSLRELMGLPPEDDRQIVPKDNPTTAEYAPNWQVAVIEAMDQRPELAAQRFVVRAADLELTRQKNGLLPDLTVLANYQISGLDNQFDQSIDRLTDNLFTDWTLAVRYRRPIGERAANAAVRRAQLALSRERYTLRNIEHTILHDLHEAYQNIITAFQLIEIQQDRRVAAAEQLRARHEKYKIGQDTLDLLLQAQTTFADALRDERQAIVQYNQALVAWEFVKGTILSNDNVALVEDLTTSLPDNVRRHRERYWHHALPLPIHPGKKIHSDFPLEDDNYGPLYPEHTGGAVHKEAATDGGKRQ